MQSASIDFRQRRYCGYAGRMDDSFERRHRPVNLREESGHIPLDGYIRSNDLHLNTLLRQLLDRALTRKRATTVARCEEEVTRAASSQPSGHFDPQAARTACNEVRCVVADGKLPP